MHHVVLLLVIQAVSQGLCSARVLAAAATASASSGSVVINEFMYHPSSEVAGEEWIELHNRGSRSVDLHDWKFSRGVKFTFPDISIAAGGYLVVAAERAKFVVVHPRVSHVAGDWRGRLANTDEIELRDADGLRVDRVRYADEGDWGIRVRALLDGWDWECPADGGGKTMELMNSALPNRRGQNWTFSQTAGGSPGRVNFAATSDVSPMIYRAMHSPAVPGSTDVVTITTEVVDERLTACDVTLHLRTATANAAARFSEQPMFDDGLHDDGTASDGVFGAQIPSLPAAAIIEYFISADDGRTRPRTWPAQARLEDGSLAQVVNAVFQVDDSVYLGTQPMIRLIMCPEERGHLDSDRFDDSLSHGTLISTDAEGTKVRYNVGIRVRGYASRREDPHNVRVQIPADRRWNGLSAFNLNTQFPYAQLMGSALCQNSGLPAANVRAVQVRLNGINEARWTQPQFGSYALLEVINAEWAANHFPLDDDGNVYGARRGNTDLRFYGMKPADYHGYTKRSNSRQNDWDDLIIMTYVLEHSSPRKYLKHIGPVVNIDEWVNYFAVMALLGHGETSPFNGEADDYDLYRGLRDTRFILLPHDMDTLLGEGDFCRKPYDHGLYNMEQLEILKTFITHPTIRAKYHARLHELMETSFSPAR
ncbi:MAG: CotH kinase family protein, partial [Planctomycetaceae bacterium]